MIFFFCLSPLLRSEETDWGASGSDSAEPLGGDPASGLQARPWTCGDQTLAEPRQTRHRTGRKEPRFCLEQWKRLKWVLLFFSLCALKGPHWDVGGHVSYGHACSWTFDWRITTETKEVGAGCGTHDKYHYKHYVFWLGKNFKSKVNLLSKMFLIALKESKFLQFFFSTEYVVLSPG